MQPIRATAVIVFILGVTLAAAQATEPTGTWLTQQGDAHIRITHCGKALCGTVVWLKGAIDAQTGKPPVDDKNPNPRKRNHKIVGLRIFAMTPDGQGNWTGGIYNSDDGQTYAGKLVLQDANALQVNGCAGALCGGETWRRVGK